MDTSKTPRVGSTNTDLPASFNPFGGKVTAVYPKPERYIGGLELAASNNTPAVVERWSSGSAFWRTEPTRLVAKMVERGA